MLKKGKNDIHTNMCPHPSSGFGFKRVKITMRRNSSFTANLLLRARILLTTTSNLYEIDNDVLVYMKHIELSCYPVTLIIELSIYK